MQKYKRILLLVCLTIAVNILIPYGLPKDIQPSRLDTIVLSNGKTIELPIPRGMVRIDGVDGLDKDVDLIYSDPNDLQSNAIFACDVDLFIVGNRKVHKKIKEKEFFNYQIIETDFLLIDGSWPPPKLNIKETTKEMIEQFTKNFIDISGKESYIFGDIQDTVLVSGGVPKSDNDYITIRGLTVLDGSFLKFTYVPYPSNHLSKEQIYEIEQKVSDWIFQIRQKYFSSRS